MARDTVLGDHHVAIKFLTSASLEKDNTFLVEMRALAGLYLLGIVTFYHQFRHQKQLALVIEHCEHGSLAQRLRAEQLTDAQAWVNQVVKWVLELCNTLTTVHARGLVHHDIKILPDLRLNVCKKEFSWTVGTRGASVTAKDGHLTGNAGIPGTGLSYRERLDLPAGKQDWVATTKSESSN